MKTLKCLLSVAVGIIVGMVASCSRSDKAPPAAPEPGRRSPDNATAPAPDNATQMPKKGDNLPVREPILE